MKKLLFCFALMGSVLSAENEPPPAEFSMPMQPAKVQLEKAMRIKFEVSEEDVTTYGLSKPQIYNEITTRLALAGVQIKENQKLPELVLRIKVIQADRAVAAFVQMGFMEPASLLRNQSIVQALTWSQATMLSCAKEDLQKQVQQVVVQMINSFILDYQKAFVS